VWPENAWTFSTPEAQGIDSVALGQAIETIRNEHIRVHSLFVERNGYAVLDAYFFPFADNETHDLASVTKSVTSTLVGIAQGENRIASLDQPISSLVHVPQAVNGDTRKERITLAQLLSMSSGLDCRGNPGENVLREMVESPHWAEFMLGRPLAYEPGSTFEYCGGSMHLVSAALTRATGQTALDLAQRNLFAPLGITQVTWPVDPDGVSHGFAGLELLPRDAAKLGHLWLHRGQWKDQQLVPADYMIAALTAHASVEAGVYYGYGMWLYPSHTPYDFEANGRGGQRITVVPEQNLVEVVTSGGADANRVAPLLAAAIRANRPLPPNPAGANWLAKMEKWAALPPAALPPQALPDWAPTIAGKTFLVSANPLGVHSLAFAFGAPSEAVVRFGFANGVVEDHAIGLDGVPRISVNTISGHHVALVGRWTGDGFDLDYDEIARIDDFRLHIVPDGEGLSIHLTEREGLADMMLAATPAVVQ
jgi:CubicO group peptidase (beta-lactamase class C family)